MAEDAGIAAGTGAVYPAETPPVQDGGVPGNLRQAIDTTTAATLRARGSFKWTAPGPGGFGAAVAEMDFGAAPAILDALARLSADAKFGYLPPYLAEELAAACADFMLRRFGWGPDPALIHPVPDVIKALEIAITHFSRPGSPVILPTPAYMPFLIVPGFLGQVWWQVAELRVGGQLGKGVEDRGRGTEVHLGNGRAEPAGAGGRPFEAAAGTKRRRGRGVDGLSEVSWHTAILHWGRPHQVNGPVPAGDPDNLLRSADSGPSAAGAAGRIMLMTTWAR